MTASARFLLLALAVCTGGVVPPARAEATGEELLQSLLPSEDDVARMAALVKQLGSPVFKEREDALEALGAFPAIAPEVLEAAREEGDPEVLARLKELAARKPEDRRSAVLAHALKTIVAKEEKGLLQLMREVLASGVACPDHGQLEQAAMATVGKDDEEALRELGKSDDVHLRRLAAGGAGGLGAAGAGLARELLRDDDPNVRLRAAVSLGNLGELEGAIVLARLLSSDELIERVRAWRALRGLTGQAFDYSPMASAEPRLEGAGRWMAWLHGEEARITGKAGEVSWRPLFNGHDLSGWTAYRRGKQVPAAEASWVVEEGVLRNKGEGPGDLRSNEYFTDYILLVEFRCPTQNADSGVGIMLTKEKEAARAGFRADGGSYLEVQILPNKSGDLYVIGDFEAEAGGAAVGFSHPRHAEVDDGPREWHEMRIEVSEGAAAVFVNGTKVNAAEGGPFEAGRILLREESSAVQFREITLLSLGDD